MRFVELGDAPAAIVQPKQAVGDQIRLAVGGAASRHRFGGDPARFSNCTSR